ncbi:MAG: GatB/YqeY domain-containing protein [Proteobacteria bacterium]|nr:GatB/YqeY domain-containing protein [Pseudomonadota bacterium]
MRDALNDALKEAMKAQDKCAISTIRLIRAALKEKDIAIRGNDAEEAGDAEILAMLQTMVKQRHDSIAMYEKGNRPELAQQERDEIEIIERFLPRQLGDTEIEAAVDAVIAEIGADGLKWMGKVMAALRERHAGQMDFGKAGAIAKKRLG